MLLRRFLAGLLLIVAAGAGAAWLAPQAVIQNLAIERAADDDYARFEAVGIAEFALGLARALLPAAALALLLARARVGQLTRWGRAVCEEWRAAARADGAKTDSPAAGWGRRAAFVVLIAAWLVWFGVHAAGALVQRARDWGYFKLRSGDQVLPNISFENRGVIRYVQQATPPDARIYVFSNQKLFFLSYYLRPRRLFHRTHPETEFAIPQAVERVESPGYRPGEAPGDDVARIQPTHILEFFQTAADAAPDRALEDPQWAAFWRRQHGTDAAPPYRVVLRPWRAAEPR